MQGLREAGRRDGVERSVGGVRGAWTGPVEWGDGKMGQTDGGAGLGVRG